MLYSIQVVSQIGIFFLLFGCRTFHGADCSAPNADASKTDLKPTSELAEVWIAEYESRDEEVPKIVAAEMKKAGLRVSGASNLGVGWVLVYEKDARKAMEILKEAKLLKKHKFTIYKEPTLKKSIGDTKEK